MKRIQFIVSPVLRARRLVRAARERRYRPSALKIADNASYPLASIRLTGAFNRSANSTRLYNAFLAAIAEQEHLPHRLYDIEGMSGRAYRRLLNALVSASGPSQYLEVGSWKGSSVISALYENNGTATCIDNWSLFGGNREEFVRNIEDFDIRSRVNIVESDFREVDFSSIGSFNLYLFDGPHKEVDQYDGIVRSQPALSKEYILLVDDWNWLPVRIGTFRALSDMQSKVDFGIEVRTTDNDSHAPTAGKHSEWHNGCFFAAISKESR